MTTYHTHIILLINNTDIKHFHSSFESENDNEAIETAWKIHDSLNGTLISFAIYKMVGRRIVNLNMA